MPGAPTKQLEIALTWEFADIGGGNSGIPVIHTMVVPVPPEYDPNDLKLFIAREVEDATWAALQDEFGRRPTRDALLAAAARLSRIRELLGQLAASNLKQMLLQALDVPNAQARALWGEDPEE